MPPIFDRKYLVAVDHSAERNPHQPAPVAADRDVENDDFNGKPIEEEKDLGFVDMPVIEMPEDLKVDLMNMFTDIVLLHEVKEEMALNEEGNVIPHGLAVVLMEANVEIRLINGELTISDVSIKNTDEPIEALITRLAKLADIESALLKMGFKIDLQPVSGKKTIYRLSKKYSYGNSDKIFLDIEAILGLFGALE